MDNRRYLQIDLRLRAVGVALLGGMVLAIHFLRPLIAHRAIDSVPLVAFPLAAGAFLAGCLGSGLTALGRHILDPVEIAERWREPIDREEGEQELPSI